MLLDNIYEAIGEFGVYQICIYCLLGLTGIPTGWQNMAITFIGGAQDHWCYIPQLQNFSHAQQKNIAIPQETKDDETRYSQCLVYDLAYNNYTTEQFVNWDRDAIVNTTSTRKCGSWVYDKSVFTSSVLSEMNLVCDNGYMASLIQTIYMAGFLTGCICVGQLSDRFGRHKALSISLFSLVVFPLGAAFVQTSYAGFVILRYLSGVAAAGSFTTAFVMSMELIGPKYRMATGVMFQGWFAIGFMTLPGIAYVVSDHVKLQMIISIPTAILWVYWIIVPESVRWLVTKGEDEQATRLLAKMAKVNNTTLPEKLELHENRQTQTGDVAEQQNATVIDLLKTPNLRKNTLVMWFAWFVTSLVYYGLSLGIGGLGGSVHVNSFISAAVEVPSYILTILVINKVGRKYMNVMTLLVGGGACLVCSGLVGKKNLSGVLTAFSMTGKFFISATFAIIYVYAAELFPTVVRSVGVGSSSMCARVGGIIQPLVADLNSYWAPIPYIIYGATSLLAGISSILLPETTGKRLPETLEEGENFGKTRKNAADFTNIDTYGLEENVSSQGQLVGTYKTFDQLQPGVCLVQESDISDKSKPLS